MFNDEQNQIPGPGETEEVRPFQPERPWAHMQKEIEEMPPIWYPEIFMVLIDAAKKHKIFLPGRIQEFVRGYEHDKTFFTSTLNSEL